jgi:hypothetical protein
MISDFYNAKKYGTDVFHRATEYAFIIANDK